MRGTPRAVATFAFFMACSLRGDWPSDAHVRTSNTANRQVERVDVSVYRFCQDDEPPEFFVYRVTYPQLRPAKVHSAVNKLIEQHFESSKEFDLEDCSTPAPEPKGNYPNESAEECEVSRLGETFVSVTCDHWTEGPRFRRARGNTSYLNYDLRTARTLQVTDVFSDLERLKGIVREAICEQFLDRPDTLDEDAIPEIVDHAIPSFGFTDSGVDFSLDKRWFSSIHLPYAKLRGILKPRFAPK